MEQKITIEPVTRVEGHGKVTIHIDENGNISQSRLHIVEFRGFERFVQGRPYWEAPVLVQRLCGIRYPTRDSARASPDCGCPAVPLRQACA